MSIALELPPATPSTFWADAACRELPPAWFHPDRGESLAEARAVCAPCAVRIDCLRWAIDNNERFGVWGGTSERERRRIKRSVARGEPVPEFDPPDVADEFEKEELVDLTIATAEPTANNGNHPVDEQGRLTDVCVNCGRRYTPDRRTQRFCRKECARSWYSSHPRNENGTRQPRVRKPRTKTPEVAAASPPAPVPAAPTGPVDVQELLGQLLAACDRWAIEADLGDIRVSVTRGCPPRTA